MKTSRCRSKALFFYLVYTSMLAVALLLALLPLLYIGLVIVDGSISAITVDSETNITLTYVHSVEHYRITERYALESCGLRLIALEWAGFGAGMPSTPTDLGDGALKWGPAGGMTSETNIKLGEYVVIAVKHMPHPRLFINSVEVSVSNNITLRTCLKISLLELVVRYIEFRLLKKPSS
ncbi:MAG: DUF1850 domain-containing protein [Sulfolobales archaeon]